MPGPKAALILLASWLASPAAAGSTACGPSVLKDAITYANGYVAIRPSWRGDWIYLCNLNIQHGNVPPQTCWSWFSQVNVAVAEGREIALWYEGATVDPSICATMPTYSSAPVPVYVHLRAP